MKHNRTTMGLVRFVIICAVFGLTSANAHSSGSGSGIIDSVTKAVGETALFNTTRDPAPYTNLSWKIRTILPIITVSASFNYTAPSYADRITLLDDGSLELRNLTLEDETMYTVQITSTEDPQFRGVFYLDVVDGPDVEVTAVPSNDTYAEGSSVTLLCTVDSKPEAHITWWYEHGFDDDQRLPFNGTELVLNDLTWEKRGFYECQAYNPRTDRYGSSSKYISVEHKNHYDGLSVGAAVGIALACVAVVSGFAGGLAYLYHRKKQREGGRLIQ